MSIIDRSAIARYTLWACVVWSLIVSASLYWNYFLEHDFTLALAKNEALANINKDISFRRWATSHGGVYVPPDAATPPNRYLDVPQRDVVTTDGQRLTLMNPAYIVRQMQQLYSETFGVKGHITSLKPINPGNTPDVWETQVLGAFERDGLRTVFAIADIDDKPYMRGMMAMVTEHGCLKCHAHQGYKEGDIRGGISASVPLEPYLARESEVLRAMVGSHAGIWFIGVLALVSLYRRALARQEEREAAEREIRELNESLDLRVQQRTAELEQVNRELESFSYSVSHDLRTPLRAINGYAHIIGEDEVERMSPAGKEMLARIWGNAERMGALIDDILQFSRIGRNEMRRESVDMDVLVRSVAEDLRGDFTAAQIRIADLPKAIGDAAMLRQVWANLLGNALKFSSKRERPEIEIGTEMQDGATVFFVRDNGAGFDMTHAGRLFGVFQRLHGASDYPGTGAGLAIVKRIVERHGGRIWAQAEVDKGATFRFTLDGQAK